ncbi:serine beta-lactamase-like protein LACTB, mitochondrial [Uloborus diversus]|uniref:serine beta-lactamase-like protein LACTB, mitochondrial n=1 Tax=Uloborus diversus TaxID=327109 RepID=UPI002409A505|nr:serine beta-lactamase-like protein LACTB, mitochondrial [Uloborus diversus]
MGRGKDELGIPGIVVGVSIDGKTVWSEGLGYADIENRVLCSPDTVMRIASISKSITMAAVAKLWEDGKLDLDKPIQEYVPYFPKKTFEGKPVEITCRQLVSHIGGIRHYDKNVRLYEEKADSQNKNEKQPNKKKEEFDHKEYYIKDQFKDVKSAIDLFKEDPLVAKPGTRFHYSTHAWTLISAIVESAAKEEFSIHLTKLLKNLGMANTHLDINHVLVYHRSRNYTKDKNGKILNAPYVDNSFKWAGGGLLSTVGDLLQFGNAMLYSLQFKPSFLLNKNSSLNIIADKGSKLSNDINQSNNSALPGYLKSKTVEALWSPVEVNKEAKYGMGWFLQAEKQECKFCQKSDFCAFHTGGAVGASSILLILPKEPKCNELKNGDNCSAPKGIIVAILVNLQSVNLSKIALKIAQIFDISNCDN